jgi:hypothetical protein
MTENKKKSEECGEESYEDVNDSFLDDGETNFPIELSKRARFVTIDGVQHEIFQVEDNWFYKYHYCKCPCHQPIRYDEKLQRYVKYRIKIPDFLDGHSHIGTHLTEQHKDNIRKGNKGKPKSEAHKIKIGNFHRGKVATLESRIKMGLSRLGEKNGMYGKTPSLKCSRGIRSYYNSPLQGEICFRSSYELKYAKYLDQNKVLWLYEIETFPLTDGLTYTPDFFLPKLEKFIEIKGYMNEKAQIRIDKFKEEYTWNLEILFKEDLINKGILFQKRYLKKSERI